MGCARVRVRGGLLCEGTVPPHTCARPKRVCWSGGRPQRRRAAAVAMETSGHTPAFLATITADVSRLVNAAHVDAIVQQLVSLSTPGILVSCGFRSSADALCWLTHPVPAEAALSVVGNGLLGPPLPSASTGGWLAVASGGSRSCFNIASSGIIGAVSLMRESKSPLCAVGRFVTAADAYRWLASASTQDLLHVLGDVSGSSLQPSARCSPPAPRHVGGSHGKPLPVAAASQNVSDDVDCVVVPVEPFQELARSPFATWISLEASRCHVTDDEGPSLSVLMRTGRQTDRALAAESSAAAHSRKRAAPTLPSPRGAQSRGALPSGTSAAAPRAVRRVPTVPLSDAEQSYVPADRGSCTCWSTQQSDLVRSTGVRRSSPRESPRSSGRHAYERHCTCAPVAKKMRELDHGGVGAARNPAGTADSDGRAMFSRAAISRMVSESRAAWEAMDRAEVLNTHADASKPHHPDPLLSSSSSSDQPRTCTVWAGSQPPTSEVGYSFATSGRDLNAAGSPAPSAAGPPVSTASLKNSNRPRDPSLSAVGGAANGAAVQGERTSTAPPRGSLGALAADGHWDVVFSRLVQEGKSTFVTGGPGVGKSTFLRGLREALQLKWPAYGEVVVVASTGSSAKTANGQTYHSFFGFPRDYEVQRKSPVEEAARLLKMERFRGISRRLAFVRVLLLDEVSMVAADKFDVMHELLRQSRSAGSPPCIIHSFGDFLQLGPLACGLPGVYGAVVERAVWRHDA